MIIKLAQEQLLSTKEKRMLLGSSLYAGGVAAGVHSIHKNNLTLLPFGIAGMLAGGRLMFPQKKEQ